MLYMSTFGKKVTSAVLTSAVVLTAIGSTAGVQAAYTNLDAANKLSSLGVIVDKSTNPSAYRLADTIQRQEALKIMMKLSGKDVSEGACTSPFSDIADSDWSCKYAVAALNNGFIAANAKFNPTDEVSKIEALKMVMKAKGFEKDMTVSDWKEGYVKAAVAKQIATDFSDFNASAERGVMFTWAAEAVSPSNLDVVTEEIDLGSLLGLDNEETTPEVTTPEVTTPEVTTPEVTTPEVTTGADNLTVSLNPETPSDGLAQADTARVPFLVFDVTAGSEDVILKEATLEFIGLGDRTLLTDVSIYNQAGEKVSKTKSFKDIVRSISFDKDIVVEAGTTMTLTVAGKIADTTGTINATFGIKLVDIKASSDVEGEDLVGALLVPAVFNNVAELKVKADKASGDITVGEAEVLAGFELEETNDNEDITLNTVTFHVEGSADEDDLTDLALYADGVEIASNLTVNSDEEIVAGNLDFTIAADDKVSFELRGSVAGSVGDNLDITFESTDDIYAVGSTSGMPVKISTVITSNTSVEISDLRNIEGSEIDVTFDQADADEAKPESDDVLIGTLKVTANADGYTLNKVTVTVTDAADAVAVIDDLKLDGSSWDKNPSNGVYEFTDIVLTKGETKNLELTMDVNKETSTPSLNGKSLTFATVISEVEDDENDVKYNTSTQLNSILSTNSFTNKTIDIKTASFTLTNTQVNDRDLVLGNGVETVIYKGKISIGDADSVEINDFDLVDNASVLNGETLDKVISSATLNIGGKTFDADIDANSIDFSSINAVIEAGADNVEVLVTAILKDNGNITGTGNKLKLKTSITGSDLEDSDGNDVTNVTIDSATINAVTTNLREQGTFSVKVLNDADTDDNLENTVLAGTSNITIAELELEAEYEDMKVDELSFKIAGIDHSNTLASVKLVNTKDNSVIADGAVITFDGTDTIIKFKDTFTVSYGDNLIEAELVADLNSITGTGDETTAKAGNMVVSVITPSATDVRGVSSSDDITTSTTGSVNSETVQVVPTKLTFSVPTSLSTGSAKITITADSGTNTVGSNAQTPEVVITSLSATSLGTDNDYNVYKDGNAAGKQTGALNTAFNSLSAADRTFDTSKTYVVSPNNQQTTTQTYTVVLSGTVATYDVVDSNGTVIATGLTTVLESDVNLGTTTVQK